MKTPGSAFAFLRAERLGGCRLRPLSSAVLLSSNPRVNSHAFSRSDSFVPPAHEHHHAQLPVFLFLPEMRVQTRTLQIQAPLSPSAQGT